MSWSVVGEYFKWLEEDIKNCKMPEFETEVYDKWREQGMPKLPTPEISDNKRLNSLISQGNPSEMRKLVVSSALAWGEGIE